MGQKKLSPKKCYKEQSSLFIRNMPKKYIDRLKEIAKENGMTMAGAVMYLVKELDANTENSNAG